MKPLPYVISKKAVADLDEIWFYTVEKWSVDQANHYYNLIIDEIDYICQEPDSGRPMSYIRKGYRYQKLNHILFSIEL